MIAHVRAPRRELASTLEALRTAKCVESFIQLAILLLLRQKPVIGGDTASAPYGGCGFVGIRSRRLFYINNVLSVATHALVTHAARIAGVKCCTIVHEAIASFLIQFSLIDLEVRSEIRRLKWVIALVSPPCFLLNSTRLIFPPVRIYMHLVIEPVQSFVFFAREIECIA